MFCRILVLVSLLALIISCQEKKSVQEKEVIPELIIKEVSASYDNCHPDSISCTHIIIEYPEYSDSTKHKINKIISDKLKVAASNYFREEAIQGTFEHIAQSFIKDYQSFKIDFPDYHFGWYVKIFAEITYESTNLISFRIDSESFTGGAHPNSSTSFFIIDVKSGRELSTADIISDTTSFKKLLELEFRKQKEMIDGQSFADRGFYINDGDFLLNDNIGITDESVLVHFNPYEIAPYSEGATTLEVSKDSMENLFLVE